MARTPPVRTAGQRPLIALVAGVVLVSSTVLALDEERRPTSVSAEPDVVMPSDGSDPGGAVSARVGPPRGVEVARYIEDRAAAMADATEVGVAVVSFDDAQTIADAVSLVGEDVTVVQVLLRLPVDTARPIPIDAAGDPVAAATAVLNAALVTIREDEDEFNRLLASGSLDDPAFEEDARTQSEALRAARTAVEGGAGVVHAVVISGSNEAIQAVADIDGVRLVDPAPPGTDPGLSTFHGLLPSDVDTVRFGRIVSG